MSTTAPALAPRGASLMRDGRPMRVLVFPGGTEIGLEIRAALADRRDVELFSAGLDVPSHAPLVYRHHDLVPDVRRPGWIEALRDVIARRGIDAVVPAYDEVGLALAESAAGIPAIVVTSPAATWRVARSKRATYAALADAVPVPRVFDDPADVPGWPVFVKPDRGQGSAGARLVTGPADLDLAVAAGSGLVMEYLPGEEHTIDCFGDRRRGLLYARARLRIDPRAGISMRSVQVDEPVLEDYARRIAARLELHGAWFFQTRRDAAGVPRLLEVAPRVAGTMALARATGVNMPLLSLLEAAGIPVLVRPSRVAARIDRALVNRFSHDLDYSTVYVDLDDTLIVRGRVNARLVGVLYGRVAAGHRVVLLTRHRGDLAATLAAHRLSSLFDAVVRVGDDEEKADHIAEPDALLIDDSFRERREAEDRLGIVALDPSQADLLADDRV
jgi:hypothetical protein